MNRRTLRKGLIATALTGLLIGGLSPATSQASILTWDANAAGAGQTNGAGAWLGANQWWNGATNVTWTSGDDAIFGGPATAGGAVTLASPTVINTLTFNPSYTGTYTLGTAGQAMTINAGINKTSGSGIVSIISPISLGGAQTWTNNSVTSLTTSNGTNLIDNGGFQLTVDGTGNTTFGVTNNAANTLKGSGALVKNGTGTLFMGGDNSQAGEFTGNVTLNAGKLFYGDFPGSLGTGNIMITGGILESRWTTGITRTQGSGTGQIQITGGESGFSLDGNTAVTFDIGAITWGSATFNPTKFLLQSSTSQANSNITIANTINLNGATRTIVVNGGTTGAARAILSGAISNGTGTAGLTKEGAGMLNLTNNTSAWSGNTTVSGGILDMGGINLANIGGGSGRNISVAAGAGIRFNALSNAILNRIVETTDEIGIMTGTTANNLDFSSSTGATLPNAFLGNWAGNGAKAELSGTITPGSNGYKLGALGSSGLLGIVGSNKLTGSAGLTVGQTGGSGIRVELAAANNFTGDTVINTGAKLTLGNNLALQNSVLNLGSAGGTFALSTGALSGRITGDTAAPSPTFGGLAGSRNLFSAFATSAGNNEQLLAATAVTGFTLNPGTGVTADYSGAIGGFGAGASGGNGGAMTLTKTGDGKQILRGVNTYTGLTTITGGTLEIASAGSINSSSGINLGAGELKYNSSVALTAPLTFTGTGGTLSGNGTINTALNITAGNFLSPGNSPGTIYANGNVDLSGTMLWELASLVDDATPGIPGTDWDRIVMNGGALTGTNPDLNLAGLAPSNDVFWTAAHAWTFLTNAGSINMTGGSISGYTPGEYGTFDVIQTANDTALTLVWSPNAIPEPATLAMIALGGLCMISKRRRHA